jgi:nicotinate phosphoribosyltransferase
VPIIQSLLDLDFYKFTMGQMVFLKYRDVPVVYSLMNRTRKVRLAEFIDESGLRGELDHVRSRSFDNSELHYLRGTNEYGERMFRESYLEFLRGSSFPATSSKKWTGASASSSAAIWRSASTGRRWRSPS